MAAAGPAALAMQVAGSIASGIENNRAARAQARVDDENARLTLLDGEQQANQTRHDERMQAGEQLAGMAGAGIQLGTGSAADLLAESAYQRELEILNLQTKASREANSLYQSAADKRAAGRGALISGMFGAATTALQGIRDQRTQRLQAAQRDSERSFMLGNAPAPRPAVVGVGR